MREKLEYVLCDLMAVVPYLLALQLLVNVLDRTKVRVAIMLSGDFILCGLIM